MDRDLIIIIGSIILNLFVIVLLHSVIRMFKELVTNIEYRHKEELIEIKEKHIEDLQIQSLKVRK